MFEVRDLRLVQAIHEHGSLVRAARVLGIAQPSLTRHLAALEAKLRGPLFERSHRGVMVTDLGRAILTEAADILGRIERLDRYATEVRGGHVRDLPVIAGAYIAESLCLVAAARMLALHPRIRIRLISANWAEVPRAVNEREAPFGLLDLRGFENDPRIEVERLRPQPGIFLVRPEHPLTARTGIDLADILAYPMVFIGRVPTELQAPMTAAREEARIRGTPYPAFPAILHESPTVGLNVLRHSDAVAAATPTIAGAALRMQEIVPLRWRAPWLSIHPGILRLRGRPLGEAEEGFLDLLRTVDREIERETLAWFHGQGIPAECN